MNIAFLTYQYVSEKPEGIPDAWPAQTVENCDVAPGENWQIMSEGDFASYKAQYQAAYSAWETAYNATPASSVVSKRILQAMDFGRQLIIDYGTKNILRGYTIEQVRCVATKLAEVQSLLSSGSLYCAKQAILEMSPCDWVTQEDKDEFLSKINAYLGL